MSRVKFTIELGLKCDRVMLPQGEGTHCVGEIYGNTLVTKRDPTKHIMRRFNAYGINTEIINSGLFENVIFEEPKQNLLITVDDMKTYSRIFHPEDEDEQYFIEIKYLTKV